MNPSRTVITFDGLAASGKSTLAKLLAQRLSFVHLNTGLLYRAVALIALRHAIDPNDSLAVVTAFRQHQLSLNLNAKNECCVLIDGVDVTAELSDPKVSGSTSQVSVHAAIRDDLRPIQRQAFNGQNMVAEGRDLGTVVFPEAVLKFFVVADEKVRVTRRVQQLLASATDQSEVYKQQLEDKIRQELSFRDKLDASRSLNPMKPAPDAVIIDNTGKTIENLIGQMLEMFEARKV